MEFTKQDNNEVLILHNTYILHRGIKHPVTKIHNLSPITAKLETEKYIVKFSKGELNLYDKVGNVLLDTFSRQQQQGTFDTKKSIRKFHLVDEYYVYLHLDENYIINNKQQENIIDVVKIGLNWTRYTTEYNNELYVAHIKSLNHKFNGIPIGEV